VESTSAVRVSAQTGSGMGDLCAAIVNWLVRCVPPAGAGVPFTPRLAAGISEVRSLLQAEKLAEALGKLENLKRECD
jgi:hypothetical protein